jgi:trans-aconitate 2-methyltransferase
VPRSWDAAAYHRLSDWQEREGVALIDRLELRGDETVLDAGCGTGRVTRHLVERLPRGRVIAVDVAPEMLTEARRNLADVADRVEIVRADLTELALDEPVDAVFSGAVLHWVLDQDLLYARLHAALPTGGRLLAWYGGEGSHEVLYRTADAIATEEPFAPYFDGWSLPIVWPSVAETVARLERQSFVDVECRIEPNVLEDVPVEYFRMLSLSIYLDELPSALADEFVERVLATQPRPYTTHINRLYIDARRG